LDAVEETRQLRIVPVPTRGLFAETKLSHCSACEEVDPTRYWDWRESPCPPAPQIQDIRPGSRRGDISVAPALPEGRLDVEPAEAAPTPGSMLAGVFDLLGKSDIFRDMSGMEQLGPLLETLVEGAVELEKTRLQQSQKGGGADKGDARRPSGEEGATGGTGGSPREPSKTEEAARASNLLKRMEEDGRINSEQESAGQSRISEGVAGGDGSETALSESAYHITGLDTGVSEDLPENHWAGALALMLFWKTDESLTPLEAVRKAKEEMEDAGYAIDPDPEDLYTENKGIEDVPADSNPFTNLCAGVEIRRRDYYPLPPRGERLDPEDIEQLLRTYGPIWVSFTSKADATVEGRPAHALASTYPLVIYGIGGDRTHEGSWLEGATMDSARKRLTFTDFDDSSQTMARESYYESVQLLYFR